MAAYLHLAPTASGPERSSRPGVPIRVVLADDHAMMRRSMRRLLDSDPDIEVASEASDPTAVTSEVRRQLPQVLVLDRRLPNGSAVDTIRGLRGQMPGTAIVVLTMEQSVALAQQMLGAGAFGFVLKDRADSELLPAVRAAARGEEYVSPRVAEGLATLRRGSDRDGLSAREIEILRQIALGYTSGEIAAKLHLSRRTVETNLGELYTKLQVATRAELVQVALRRHLIGA